MSVLINLLPDVRQAKNRARKLRQISASIATLVVAVSLGSVLLLFLITSGQGLRIKGLTQEIAAKQTELNSKEDLQELVTLQQHLNSLPGLYDRRVYMTKFFELLSIVSPTEVSINNIELQSSTAVMFNGNARSYAAIDKFVKAMEAANISLGEEAKEGNTPYFSGIKIGGGAADGNNKVSFTGEATISQEVTSGK